MSGFHPASPVPAALCLVRRSEGNTLSVLVFLSLYEILGFKLYLLDVERDLGFHWKDQWSWPGHCVLSSLCPGLVFLRLSHVTVCGPLLSRNSGAGCLAVLIIFGNSSSANL